MSLVMKRPALMLLLGIALVAVGFGIGLKTGRARPFVAIAASPSDHSAAANKQFDEPKPIKAVTKPASESDAPAKEQTRDWKRPDHIKDFVVYDDGGGAWSLTFRSWTLMDASVRLPAKQYLRCEIVTTKKSSIVRSSKPPTFAARPWVQVRLRGKRRS